MWHYGASSIAAPPSWSPDCVVNILFPPSMSVITVRWYLIAHLWIGTLAAEGVVKTRYTFARAARLELLSQDLYVAIVGLLEIACASCARRILRKQSCVFIVAVDLVFLYIILRKRT